MNMTPKPTLLKILDVASVLLLAVAAYLALVYAGTEQIMGDVQRVFYFHIGTAWTGLLGFLFSAGLGITYLVKKDLKWDVMEVAAVEISVVFFFITIILGSIWARPAWNTWWTWDPRLTTAAITELVYVAYFMLRSGVEDPDRRARFGAVYAVLGGISAPITFLTIRLFRSIHPIIIAGGKNQQTMNMTSDMKVAFFFALFTFTVIFIDLFWNRIRLGQLEAQVEQLKLKVM